MVLGAFQDDSIQQLNVAINMAANDLKALILDTGTGQEKILREKLLVMDTEDYMYVYVYFDISVSYSKPYLQTYVCLIPIAFMVALIMYTIVASIYLTIASTCCRSLSRKFASDYILDQITNAYALAASRKEFWTMFELQEVTEAAQLVGTMYERFMHRQWSGKGRLNSPLKLQLQEVSDTGESPEAKCIEISVNDYVTG